MSAFPSSSSARSAPTSKAGPGLTIKHKSKEPQAPNAQTVLNVVSQGEETSEPLVRPESISEATWALLPEASKRELVEMAEAMKAKAKAEPKKYHKPSPQGTGTYCVYGFNSRGFPITLYPGQWLDLAKLMPEILAGIEKHKANLCWEKNDPRFAEAQAKSRAKSMQRQSEGSTQG
jgi:hypothetical protein